MSSFQGDQLQPEDTLEDRGVDDVLDEGMSPPERPSPVTAHGATARDLAEGETLEERLAQEEPDPTASVAADSGLADHELDDPAEDVEVGADRSGRLVAPDLGTGEDRDQAPLADDVGIDGAGAAAEEAAVHTIDEE
jgi:hypothetical protein